VGKFAPLHVGHQWLLDHAHSLADVVTVVLWSNPDFAEMPTGVRADWVRALYPSACVLVGDDGPPNSEPDDVHREYTRAILAKHDRHPDVVTTRESYGPGLAEHLGIAHEWVASERSAVDVSGTLLRTDVHAHRHLLHPRVYEHFVERVVLMGAESTGKSTLTDRLAVEFGTAQVQEYGREHYAERGGQLDLDDYVTIAQVHREREDEAIKRVNRYLFVDTNAVTTMFFSHYYNRDSLPELHRLADECATRYRHVIVCDDDIPFEQDGWRDNDVWRARMQGMVLHDLRVRRIPFHVVTGPLETRLEQVRFILSGQSSRTPRRLRSLGPRAPGSEQRVPTIALHQ
jgi:NadR type nicotinamide-nucleotide adenylyltransferase